MGRESSIAWTHATWNPWRGCERVSEGCRHCYAAAGSRRNPAVLGVWGGEHIGKRVVGSAAYFDLPLRWNDAARKAGERRRVFCASYADVFEDWHGPMLDVHGRRLAWCRIAKELKPTVQGRLLNTYQWATMDHARLMVFDVIRQTPHLDWLLVTKRPQNAGALLQRVADLGNQQTGSTYRHVVAWLRTWLMGQPPENIWMLTSVEDQETADARIPHLLAIPAAVRGVSYEPALGPVDFAPWLEPAWVGVGDPRDGGPDVPALDWIIVGGESGPHARPFDLAWARSVVRHCREKDVACFVKQVGRRPVDTDYVPAQGCRHPTASHPHPVLYHPKGEDPAEWPAELRVREYP